MSSLLEDYISHTAAGYLVAVKAAHPKFKSWLKANKASELTEDVFLDIFGVDNLDADIPDKLKEYVSSGGKKSSSGKKSSTKPAVDPKKQCKWVSKATANRAGGQCIKPRTDKFFCTNHSKAATKGDQIKRIKAEMRKAGKGDDDDDEDNSDQSDNSDAGSGSEDEAPTKKSTKLKKPAAKKKATKADDSDDQESDDDKSGDEKPKGKSGEEMSKFAAHPKEAGVFINSVKNWVARKDKAGKMVIFGRVDPADKTKSKYLDLTKQQVILIKSLGLPLDAKYDSKSGFMCRL